MRMNKTTWRPIAIGSILGLLSFVSSAGGFLIHLGFSGEASGPQEIPLILSAVFGGPLGLFLASLIHELGISLYVFKSVFSPDQMSSTVVAFAIADFSAHVLALLAAAYGYRFLYQRANKLITFLAGWIFIVAAYYTLLVFLQSILVGMVIPDTPFSITLMQDFLPEFQMTLIITTLIIVALPRRYRKPLWYESTETAPQSGGRSNPRKENTL